MICPSYGYGRERMPADGALVVAVNHFSEIDPAIVGLHSLRTLYFMAKIELLRVPIGGELLRWTGAFAVRRGEGDRDSLRVARWALWRTATPSASSPREPGSAWATPARCTRARRCWRSRRACRSCLRAWTRSGGRSGTGARSCVVWGEPFELDLPRNGKGYKEGTAVVQERVTDLWRQAAQAVADGFPKVLANGLRRHGPAQAAGLDHPPGAAELADRGVGRGAARAGLQGGAGLHSRDKDLTEAFRSQPTLPRTGSKKGDSMGKHWIVGASTLIGIGAVVATGAGAAVFGTQSSARSFARVARPDAPAGRVAPNLMRLRGVNFVSGCGFSHATTTTRSSSRGGPASRTTHTFLGNSTTNAFSTLDTLRGGSTSCRRPSDTAAYWVPTLVASGGRRSARVRRPSITGAARSRP